MSKDELIERLRYAEARAERLELQKIMMREHLVKAVNLLEDEDKDAGRLLLERPDSFAGRTDILPQAENEEPEPEEVPEVKEPQEAKEPQETKEEKKDEKEVKRKKRFKKRRKKADK